MKLLRKVGPLKEALTSGLKCAGCTQGFEAGQYITLLPIGPGDDPEARERARAGRAYTGVAIPLHWACATGDES